MRLPETASQSSTIVSRDPASDLALQPLRRAFRRRRVRFGALVMAAAAILFGSTGCFEWFKPATPEPPASQGPNVDVSLDFGDPEAVLATVIAAVAARGGGNGAFAYRSAFADSATDGIKYVCEYATEVVIERTNSGRNIPVWSREQESLFYTYLLSLASGDYLLAFSDYDGAPIDDIGTDEQTLYRQYDVVAIPIDGGTETQVAHGRVDLVFRRIQQEWAIVRWVDRIDPVVGADPEDPGQRSFSRLRIDSVSGQ